ncbi:SUMO-activating enzyme subunit 1 [Microplitis demolitor]|uniref:SUMO-activating enzyme subunit 1 n=1 Tax=Microplitis demolitor TaxID=69319 RepID=UPI0004CD0F84|nr:SUMO-activating enzyme subunit 1 [Microplitis demolitor]
MADNTNGTEMLTDAEAELYDRQIRLWGLESQKRLRMARVLLIGMNGFSAEVAKNIILAGVKSVTFLDHRNVDVGDSCSQFFVTRKDIGTNRATASIPRAQNLNPMVKVTADEDHVDSKDDEYFKDFDVICASECTITQLKKLNDICRNYGVKFFAGDVWGTFGYTFSDLIIHEYVMEVVQTRKTKETGTDKPKIESTIVNVRNEETFVPIHKILDATKLPKDTETYYLFQVLLNYREKHRRDPLPNERDCNVLLAEARAIIEKNNLGDKMNYLLEGDLYAQTSPTCAIIGGIMGQEIIKTVSQKEPPHNNLFLFNPHTMCGKVVQLGY